MRQAGYAIRPAPCVCLHHPWTSPIWRGRCGTPSIDALLAGIPPDDADPDAELWRHAQLAYEVLKDLPTRARRVEAMLAMQALAEHFAGQARRRPGPPPPITDPDPIPGGAA
jgi:hypothetical protein